MTNDYEFAHTGHIFGSVGLHHHHHDNISRLSLTVFPLTLQVREGAGNDGPASQDT